MASQIDEAMVSSPQFVGDAFVQLYYTTLKARPEATYKFYDDSSMISRPGPDGNLASMTTKEGINELLLSFNCQNNNIDILTVDAQSSHQGGMIVLVMGFLVRNNDRKKFVQSFFLVPQDCTTAVKNYFVLNDVFRFIDDVAGNDAVENAVATTAELAKDPVGQSVEVEVSSANTENLVGQPVDAEKPIAGNGDVALENGHVEENGHANENGLVENLVDSVEKEVPASPLQDAVPVKKTFASVVNALKQNSAPFQVRAPPPKSAVRVPAVSKPEAPVATPASAPAPTANGAPEKTADPAAKAHAIFVANLPMTTTVDELDKLFKQFGPIKPDGIQVRSSKQQGTCFGFVEFESAGSMQSALEASPVVFGSRKLSIEERRASNDKPKFASGRSGYRNDNFRGGRGNFNGNRSFGRNDFERRGEFSGRARGNDHGGRNGEYNHKPNSNAEVKSSAPEEVKA